MINETNTQTYTFPRTSVFSVPFYYTLNSLDFMMISCKFYF